MSKLKHFKISEFDCKCGCKLNKQTIGFLVMLDHARHIAQTPFIITSGTRCFEHNQRVGGSPTSSHLKGLAADIKFSNGLELVKIIYGLTLAGFKRIGINEDKKFVHVDTDSSKPNAIFNY